FACIEEAWRNLPEKCTDHWWARSPEHLRKFALIETAWCDTTVFQLKGDNDVMLDTAIKLRQRDPHSKIEIAESCLIWSTAFSQAENHMTAMAFQKSKNDVLDYLAGLLSVTRDELETVARSQASERNEDVLG